VAIALPITQPGEEPNDSRHYTKWGKSWRRRWRSATPINPAPEDPGTAREPEHYTEWTPK
jgi:hypothetical protein